MKKAALIVTIVFAWMLVFAVPGWSGPVIDRILAQKELVVGTSATYPPLTFKSKDGNVYGFDIDLARMIAGAMDVKLRTVVIPFDELISALERGKIDMIISNMTITPQRNLRVAYAGPYFVSGQSILTRKEDAAGVGSPEDINRGDFSIAVARETTAEQVAARLLPKARIVVVKSTDEAIRLLKEKKVNAVMAGYPFLTVEAFRNLDRGFVANRPLSMEFLGIGVLQDDPLLLNFLDNFLKNIREDGLLSNLTLHWFSDPSWVDRLP